MDCRFVDSIATILSQELPMWHGDACAEVFKATMYAPSESSVATISSNDIIELFARQMEPMVPVNGLGSSACTLKPIIT